MHCVVFCPSPFLPAPSLSRRSIASPPLRLAYSPPRLLGSSTLASSQIDCVALLLSALLPALLAALLFALTMPLSALAARRRLLPSTSCCTCRPCLSCFLVLGENCRVAFPCQIFGRLPWGSPASPPLSLSSSLLFFFLFFLLSCPRTG